MNIAILDAATGTVHLTRYRGTVAELGFHKYCRRAKLHPGSCEWMEFKRVHGQRRRVVIDVRGGVAYLRRPVRGVSVQIVDHDHH